MAGTMPTNPAGLNQLSPTSGLMPNPNPISVPGGTLGTSGTGNPFSVASGSTGPGPGMGTVPGGSLYDSNNLVSNTTTGETNTQKQLMDIYGKGIGGELNYILQNMQGTDSAILEQFKQSMIPEEAGAKASLNEQLGAEGVSGNSSVAAIADSNLEGQFNAEVAKEDSSLMQQQLQDTIGILTGTQADAAKETASSGWDVFGQVMQGLGSVAGSVVSAAGAAGGFGALFA